MKWLVALILTFFITLNSYSQDYSSQRAQMLAFNVGFNGIVGGLGSFINKSDSDNFWTSFSRGFYKGAIGGTISHVGFSLTHQISERNNISYAWPARLVNSFGSSIIQNAAENRRMLERLHLNMFVARLEYYPYEHDFKARLFSSSIYGIAITGKNARLDLLKSLQSGVIYFESDYNFSIPVGSGLATGQVSSVGMRSDLTDEIYYDVFAHEMVHILQFDRKVGGNALVRRLDEQWKNDFNWYKRLSKYIYFDLNGPIFYYAYKLEGSVHFCNFFEQEAEHYSARRYYGCN